MQSPVNISKYSFLLHALAFINDKLLKHEEVSKPAASTSTEV